MYRLPLATLANVFVVVPLLLNGGQAKANETSNLLAVCSNPDTAPHDALMACRRVAEKGKLDRKREGLVWMNAGIAAFALGLYGDAVHAHTAAIKADPRLSAAFENRARAYERQSRIDEALADYASAISIRPQQPGAYLGRGTLMLNRGAPERALPDFGRALELDPNSIPARFNRGIAFLQLGQHRLAEIDFSDVIGRNPRDAGAYLNRGRARAAMDKPKAFNDLDRAVALQPEWGQAWFIRGRYREEQGDVEAANADYLRAYQLGHSDPWLIQRVRELSGQ